MNRALLNYFDNDDGREDLPITFEEFLTKPESIFIYADNFLQIPGYIQSGAELAQVEETARTFAVNWLVNEFSDRLIGMSDYKRWARLFENKCMSVAPSFWAQVNMINLMYAKDLEMDTNVIERTAEGGGSTTLSHGKRTNEQDIHNWQETDTSTREANATVVRAEDQLTDSIEYEWADAADSVHEIRNRAGDSYQHMDSSNEAEDDVTTSTNGNTSTDTSNLTNKQFIQERQWSIETARDLLPLEWLKAQLRPLFYLLY